MCGTPPAFLCFMSWSAAHTYFPVGRVQTAELEALVDAAAAGIDRHVTSVLLGKHRFVAHCDAIKRYLLLCQVRHSLSITGSGGL